MVGTFLQFIVPFMLANPLERKPRKKTVFLVLAGTTIFALLSFSFVLFYIADKAPLFTLLYYVVFWVVLWVCMGAIGLIMGDMWGKCFTNKQRSGFLGTRFMIGSLSGIAIAVIAEALLEREGVDVFKNSYAPIYLVATGLFILTYTAFALMREPVHAVRKDRKPWGIFIRDAVRECLVKDVSCRAFCLMRVFQMCGFMAAPLGPLYMRDTLGLPRTIAARMGRYSGYVHILTYPLFGWLGNHLSSKFILQASCILHFVGSILHAFVPALVVAAQSFLPEVAPERLTTIIFLAAVMVAAAGHGTQTLGRINYPIDISMPIIRPTYIAFTSLVVVPFVLMQQLGGWLADVTPWKYQTVFFITALFQIAALACSPWMKNVLHTPKNEEKTEEKLAEPGSPARR